jgi:hypothetical protein
VDHRPFGQHDPATCDICIRLRRDAMSYEPSFQAQNPAISGYPLGWESCTAFAGAMAIDYATLGAKRPTGGQVRTLTHDTVGGLTLAQIDEVALDDFEVNLNTIYRLPWTEYETRRQSGEGAVLQLWYGPIADSPFDAGRGFRGNHAVMDPPSAKTKDPLADGRYGEAYKYQGAVYPRAMLREAAGKLNLSISGYSALGAGLVYASFTRDNTLEYEAHVGHGVTYTRYTVAVVNGRRQIIGHRNYVARSGFTAPCSAPKPVRRQTIAETVQLVKVAKPGSPMNGVWIAAKYAREV